MLSNARALALIAVLFAGCGTPPSERDGGPLDAGLQLDGGGDSAADAGDDGSEPAADGGPPGCLAPTIRTALATDRLEDELGTATVAISDREACLRTYTLTSTAARRDDLPTSPRTITEREGEPSIRTGNDLHDALFALALDEARQNAVDAVRDHAFDEGRAVDCGEGGCFETGRLWNYVWTRDTAYSVALGLAAIDPERAMRSLAWKTSERRGGGGLEIVQDTGSGGSWPVSTDRVSWALGAAELLPYLDEPERASFAELALRALRGTIERDRRVIFDERDGLYRGEQSFLDWREQSYPSWVAGDVVHIAMSRSLSTNVLHLRALEIAADLASGSGDAASASRWRGWAVDLRAAIRERLWDEEAGLFATYLTTELDRSRPRRWDLLGQSLAILAGVADEAQAARILERYPHLGAGAAPVIAPQQQRTRIYHNRAEWPFVTALWLRAAVHRNDRVADRAVRALVRGAALNLSNMENLETVSGAAFVEDGAYSGPVVNSQRQLWSVAGYLGMIQHAIFGIDVEGPDTLALRPWVSGALRRDAFGAVDELVLRGFPWGDQRIDIVLRFPEDDAGEGHYEAGTITVDGAAVAGPAIDRARLAERSRIDVALRVATTAPSEITVIDADDDWRAIYGPSTPSIPSLALEGARVRVAIDLGGEPPADVRITIHRDGAPVATDLPGTTTSYLDELDDAASTTHCWSIETCFVASGTCSQHAAPSCFWGAESARATTIDAARFVAVGGSPVSDHGRFHYEAWGDPGDRLEASGFVATASGRHLIQAEYANGGPIDSGITCAVKRVLVEDEATGALVGGGVLVMPHLGTWDRWGDSSFVEVELAAGRTYRIVVRDDDDTVNMSAFEHFSAYTGGVGGRDGAFSRVDIAALRVLALGL
jgi:hypothetical protein